MHRTVLAQQYQFRNFIVWPLKDSCTSWLQLVGKGKGKGRPGTGHKDPNKKQGEIQLYIFVNLDARFGWMVKAMHRERGPVPVVYEAVSIIWKYTEYDSGINEVVRNTRLRQFWMYPQSTSTFVSSATPISKTAQICFKFPTFCQFVQVIRQLCGLRGASV
jgi:hypothetical protein